MTQAVRRIKLRAIIFAVLVTYSIYVTWNVYQNLKTCPNICQTEPKVVYVEKETPSQELEISANDETKFTFDLRSGRWDNQILYRIFDRVIVGDNFYELTDTYKVCLATQSSLEKLGSIAEVTTQWNGPLSVAVYAAGNDELSLVLLYISFLRKCVRDVREKVAFHIALPKDRMPNTVEYDTNYLSRADCKYRNEFLKQVIAKRSEATRRWREKNPYPQNHMRNLARKNCVTPYVFLTDIDIVPSNTMAEKLNNFLQEDTCEKCAYVIPTYEIDSRVPFPPNKSEIVRLATKTLARPFHEKVFIYNQYATNFSRWEQDATEGNVRVSHPVTNFEMFYEPFFVSRDGVPPHDERFIGYGFTRNTQAYEMFVAGYQFQVLTPVFAIHWGLQDRRNRPYWREKQNAHNNKLFQTFKRELFARYQNDPLHLVNKESQPQRRIKLT